MESQIEQETEQEDKDPLSAEDYISLANLSKDLVNGRRQVQWKINFGFWTGLGLIAYFVLPHVKPFWGWGLCIIITVVVVLAVWIFAWHSVWMATSGHKDMDIIGYCRAIALKGDGFLAKALKDKKNLSEVLNLEKKAQAVMLIDTGGLKYISARKKLKLGQMRSRWLPHVFLTVLLGAAALLALWTGHPLSGARHESRTVTARTFKVERVVDGNTFEIIYDGEPTHVRLSGIHVADSSARKAPEATKALTELIGDKTVRLEFSAKRKRDKSGSLVAHVYLGNVDVGVVMTQHHNLRSRQKSDPGES